MSTPNLRIVEAVAQCSIPTESQTQGRECYAFSAREDAAFEAVKVYAYHLMETYEIPREACEVKTDAIGNLFVTFFGQDRSRAIMSGSHVDSVLQGGKFDGVAGVNSAMNFLEKVFAAHKNGQESQMNYTVAVFRGEESSPKTGATCLGSRIATGTITPQELEQVMYMLDDGKKIPFRMYLQTKYGEAEGEQMWADMLAEIANPPLTAANVAHYEELHIEQSGVCEALDVDVGIVIDGIGGAVRQVIKLPLRRDLIKSLNLSRPDSHKRITFTFTGEEAHTGGTPPNTRATYRHDTPWYRKDALIAASHFVEGLVELFQDPKMTGNIQILNISVPELTGYTTVPKLQTVELLVPTYFLDPRAEDEPFGRFLKHNKQYMSHFLRTELTWKSQPAYGVISYLDPAAMEAMEIPSLVERLARTEVARQVGMSGESVGVGRIRGTVTDFRMSPASGSIDCNLDFRDVDPEAMRFMLTQVRSKVSTIAGHLVDSSADIDARGIIRTVSEKAYVPVDPQAVVDKTTQAESLGFTHVKMPSLPGHDAASLGQAGIPISMTFVRHDGLSHNARETMPAQHYLNAEALSHAFLAQKLGLGEKV